MASPYAVALVVVPNGEKDLRSLSSRLHVWVADTPQNRKIAESIWSTLPSRREYNIEAGVTIFTPHGITCEDWCLGVIDALDQHHNNLSHNPGFTILEVYGAVLSGAIRQAFSEYGFVNFIVTAYGFVAHKTEP